MARRYSIVVAGTGYVGLVAGACFAERGHSVVCVDTDADKVAEMAAGRSPIYEEGLEELMRRNIAEGRLSFTTDYTDAYRDAEAIFIGVGTPEREDGSADLSYISVVARQIAESVERDCLVVVKSTVPVGTNDKVERTIRDFLAHDVEVEVASNPEFLAQGVAVRDTLEAARVVIGVESERARRAMEEIYEPFGLPLVFMSRRSAEMTKYASNDFLALKISYINDIANLCERVGADVSDVARGMSYDERIGSKFLHAGIGFGGSCFPKDTKALRWLARRNGYELKTVSAAVEVNERQKTLMLRKVQDRFMSLRGLRVAVLGLTFKPGTDDLREAPSLENVPALVRAGADVVVYDPVGAPRFQARFPELALEYAASAAEALDGAHAALVLTEWPEICALVPGEFASNMAIPLVFDGRNCLDAEAMRAAGVEYHGVGRGRA